MACSVVRSVVRGAAGGRVRGRGRWWRGAGGRVEEFAPVVGGGAAVFAGPGAAGGSGGVLGSVVVGAAGAGELVEGVFCPGVRCRLREFLCGGRGWFGRGRGCGCEAEELVEGAAAAGGPR